MIISKILLSRSSIFTLLDFSGVAPYLFIINALIFQGQLVRSFTCFLLLKQKLSLAPWTLSGLFSGACDTHRLNLSPLL